MARPLKRARHSSVDTSSFNMAKPEQTEQTQTQPKPPPAPKKRITGARSIGRFQRKSDGEIYDVVVHDPDPIFGRTHTATNEVHHWRGSVDAFILDFKNGDGTSLNGSEKWT